MKPFGRRRQFLIDALQIKLLTINLVYMTAMILLFVSILFGPLVLIAFEDSTTAETKTDAAERMLLLHKSVWPAVIVLVVVFIWHSVLYTHRIAGPLYRFRRVMENVAAGDLRVRAGVRTRDYLRAESAAINRMIEGLASRVRAVKNASEQVGVVSRKLDCLRGRSDSEQLKDALECLQTRIESLVEAVEIFRLPEDVAAMSSPPGAATEKPEHELVPS